MPSHKWRKPKAQLMSSLAEMGGTGPVLVESRHETEEWPAGEHSLGRQSIHHHGWASLCVESKCLIYIQTGVSTGRGLHLFILLPFLSSLSPEQDLLSVNYAKLLPRFHYLGLPGWAHHRLSPLAYSVLGCFPRKAVKVSPHVTRLSSPPAAGRGDALRSLSVAEGWDHLQGCWTQ